MTSLRILIPGVLTTMNLQHAFEYQVLSASSETRDLTMKRCVARAYVWFIHHV